MILFGPLLSNKSCAIISLLESRHPFFNGPAVLASAYNKANLFTEIFFQNFKLDDSGYLFTSFSIYN